MSGFNPFRNRFPYTNINDINLDWIIKKVRKLSEDVAEINPEHIEEVAQQAAAAEQTAQDALETAEGVSGIASDAETIARAAQTTANNAADSAQAAGTAAAAAQTTADAAGTAAAAAQTTADAAGTAAAAAQNTADAAGTAAAAAQTTANQNRVAIAIVASENTAPQNISAGQYVIWGGGLYTASTAIASGATLSSSNLTAVTGGGLNDVGGKLSALQNAAVTTVAILWGSNLTAQTVTVSDGLYLVAVDTRNSATDEKTGLYIVESNATYNSHVTTIKQPTTPMALISIAAGVLTVSPQVSYGFAAIVKLTN